MEAGLVALLVYPYYLKADSLMIYTSVLILISSGSTQSIIGIRVIDLSKVQPGHLVGVASSNQAGVTKYYNGICQDKWDVNS